MVVAFQEAFVRLCADAVLRRAYLRDPEGVLAELALGESARAALRAIPVDDLERYARSLIAKRCGEVAKVVPLTLRVAAIEPSYRDWLAVHPATFGPSVHSPGLAEAVRAERAIFDALCGDEHPAFAADLWCFEVRRAASRADGIVRSQRARFEIQRIAADLERGLVPFDPPGVATELRFERDRVLARPA